MKMNRILLRSAVCLGAVAALMSCSKDETFPSYEEFQKQTYASNFEAKYGTISPTQTWDFSTGERQLATRGATSIMTEVLDNGIDWGDVSKINRKMINQSWMHYEIDIKNSGAEKNGALLNAIASTLPEKKSWTGQSVVLVAPASSFYIYPLFCGGRLEFDLKVKVGNQEPVTVFNKNWKNFQCVNGMWKNEVVDGERINMRGMKIEAPVGTPVEVYIDNIADTYNPNNIRRYPAPADVAGTTNGRAVYVDIPEGIRPELDGIELKENAVVKYIGIEDVAASGGLERTDNDFNDVVLAVVGNPDVPQEKIITNDSYEVKTVRAKRYLIEDLGATDDFDFNDVVVDIEDNTIETHKVTYENGVLKTDEIISTKAEPTKAVIRAMGGTIDFELVVGETVWTKSGAGFNVGSMYNTQGNIDFNKVLAEFEVKGWDSAKNNVSIRVNGKDGQIFAVTFPKAGEAPMIIAVDASQDWMKERESVPSTWFYEPKK